MKRAFLAMSIIGFIAPALFTWSYMQQHPDNILFLTNPAKSFDVMFGTYGRAAFSTDLLVVMVTFSCWVILEGRRLVIRHAWIFIPLTFLLGLSGPFPLFLYVRERSIEHPFL